ncbi:MAG: ATP synthase F1 subunit epsilon [Lachnospiraceae bacterium]|nr:ATP synthase F1 subunit epsilon [Lachnospiraceae bacterium]
MADTDNLFDVTIITPEREFYSGKVKMLEFNTTEGEIGIYKNHIPLTTVIAPGIVTLTEADDVKCAAVHAGFAEILGDAVTILAEIAEWPPEIDVDRAKRAEDRARGRIDGKDDSLDMLRAEIALKKSLVRQDVVARSK